MENLFKVGDKLYRKPELAVVIKIEEKEKRYLVVHSFGYGYIDFDVAHTYKCIEHIDNINPDESLEVLMSEYLYFPNI